MLQRIRLALQDDFFGKKLGGPAAKLKLMSLSSAARRATCA
jgi:hypothetical protein